MFRTDACCCFSFSLELEALRLQLLYPPVSKGRSALASALRSFVLLLGLKLRTDYTTSFLAYRSSSSGDAWPQAYHLDVNAMRSYSASRVAELAKEAGPTLGLYKRIQSMYVVSLVDCYIQKGWLETQLNLPMVEGLEPLQKEYIPGPPTSITQYMRRLSQPRTRAAPAQSCIHPGRLFQWPQGLWVWRMLRQRRHFE